MNIGKEEPRIYKAMGCGGKATAGFQLDPRMVELVKLRVSQVERMRLLCKPASKDARKAGETEQRVFAGQRLVGNAVFTDVRAGCPEIGRGDHAHRGKGFV